MNTSVLEFNKRRIQARLENVVKVIAKLLGKEFSITR
jgi:hypothetical protein